MGRILGVDYGEARTGLAVSDALGFLANGIGNIEERDINRLLNKLAEKAAEDRNGASREYERHLGAEVGKGCQISRQTERKDGTSRNTFRRKMHHYGSPSIFERNKHPRQKAQGGGGHPVRTDHFAGLP